jgi:OOP family OmpA-OmpF porin
MKYGMTAAAAAAIIALAPVMAKADTSPLYLQFGGGLSILEDADFSGPGFSSTVGFDNGWGVYGAVGLGLFDSVRGELELSQRNNSADDLHGAAKASALMANFYYDFGSVWGFSPFIGAGVGGMRIKADNIGPFAGASVDDTDTAFGYQGIIGLSAPLTSNWKFVADYRYMSTFDEPSFSSSVGTSVDGEYRDHLITVGFRYTFGAPPAAAPMATPVAAPAPAPAPAPVAQAPALVRSFQVFFDFDKSDITADARRVIEQATANTKQAGTTRVTLTGHTDTSGSAQYNQRLSQRRADAVKAEMVRMGVPANDISTVARGESSPLVATADGVREPRNRRVEIVF